MKFNIFTDILTKPVILFDTKDAFPGYNISNLQKFCRNLYCDVTVMCLFGDEFECNLNRIVCQTMHIVKVLEVHSKVLFKLHSNPSWLKNTNTLTSLCHHNINYNLIIMYDKTFTDCLYKHNYE